MTTHHFTPDHYHNTIGSHPPVLHIAPGDTIVTTTVDAWGQDSNGNRVTEGSNPMTGPFYVDGAEPGDTLVMHIDRLTPNRPQGWGRPALAANIIDPEEARNLPPRDPILIWNVDTASGTASLANTEGTLSKLRLPIKPMLGCFGVAPIDGQGISTATSGEFGGNMDYNGFVEGVTVYFPVFAPGALLYLGDGHALQGDGEISGTGIEISFEVQFTVNLIKGKVSGWPRGENADYIFTAGNARPLDQATQHATTEMLRWLQADYRLSAAEANILLGYCVEYEVGNVFDPAYTMICKIPKRVLQQLG